jgi:phosphatidylglycerol:prolipoprotein diacylglycerol transferase
MRIVRSLLLSRSKKGGKNMINAGEMPIAFPRLGLELDFPNYFSLFGFPIYFYAIFICAGVVLAYIYCSRRAKQFHVTVNDLLDGLIFGVPIGIVGARLWYCAFAPKGEITKFADIFNIRDGGLAIYGGIFFVGIFVIFFCRYKKLRLGNILDLVSLGFIIGQMMGRWGNFVNREVYGVATALPWGMRIGNQTVHPLFLYEILWNLIGFIALHIISKKYRKFPGQIALMYMGWYGLGRAWMEGLRNTKYIETLGTLPIHQLVAMTVFVICVFVLIVKFIDIKKNGPANFEYVPKTSKKIEQQKQADEEYTPMYGQQTEEASEEENHGAED